MIEEQKSLMDRLQESVTVKMVFIIVLTLVLLIPSSMVDSIIRERAGRQDEAEKEVAENWSGSQLIAGPVLVIPYHKNVKFIDGQKESIREITENLYILPDALHIKDTVAAQTKQRGIFKAVVYNSVVNVSGKFNKADLNQFSILPEQLILNKARLILSISDLKGLKNNPVVNAANQQSAAAPAFDTHPLFANSLQAAIDLSAVKDGAFTFNYVLDIKGSGQLHFMHLGKTTSVEAAGNWPDPSFDGNYLPDTHRINARGFTANWHMVYYNRPYPQQWVADDTLFYNVTKEANASFGFTLRLPVDEYQKTMRTSKYAILIIILTFVSLFMTELIRKQRIHIFNYLLIGAAMIVYYSLLLSFAEQVGFDYAYLIASVSTIALVAVFIASLLRNRLAAGLFAFILSIFYLFIYVIIQLEDFALLMGSIALFIIVALLMFFSRRINWDKH